MKQEVKLTVSRLNSRLLQVVRLITTTPGTPSEFHHTPPTTTSFSPTMWEQWEYLTNRNTRLFFLQLMLENEKCTCSSENHLTWEQEEAAHLSSPTGSPFQLVSAATCPPGASPVGSDLQTPAPHPDRNRLSGSDELLVWCHPLGSKSKADTNTVRMYSLTDYLTHILNTNKCISL